MSRERYLSLVHFIVGAGSPTELQGRRTSFIHGVVTVPPKDRILAGTAQKFFKNVFKRVKTQLYGASLFNLFNEFQNKFTTAEAKKTTKEVDYVGSWTF